MDEQRFLIMTWSVTPQGSYTLSQDGHEMVILRGMTCMPTYTLQADGNIITHFQGARITDVETAKRAAWEWLQEVTKCTTK